MAVKGGCIFLVKILLFIFNFILWMGGGCLFGYALYLRLDFELKAEEDELSDLATSFFIGLYVLMVTGGVIMIIGFLGCCGAIKENVCQLSMYFISVFVVVAIEIGGGIWIFLNQGEVIDTLQERMGATYTEDFKLFIDLLQEKLACCGIKGPEDWAKNNLTIPDSCGIGAATTVVPGPRDDDVQKQHLETTGCVDRIYQYITTIFIIVGGIICLQILVIVFSVILCRAIREADDYDDDDRSFA